MNMHASAKKMGEGVRRGKESFADKNGTRTPYAKFQWLSLSAPSRPNHIATPAEKSNPTAQFKACHSTMGTMASISVYVCGRMASTARR